MYNMRNEKQKKISNKLLLVTERSKADYFRHDLISCLACVAILYHFCFVFHEMFVCRSIRQCMRQVNARVGEWKTFR